MNIVVLDGYTLNPGDLSWQGFEEIGQIIVYDRTSADLVVKRSLEADIILTNKTPVRSESLNQLPKLKYIGVLATGYDIVDVETARENRIVVTNIPSYGTSSVAQMVFAHLLELCHHVQRHSDDVKKGAWAHAKDWCYWNYPQIELAGKTMGIIGLGRIGLQTAKIAGSFGMNVIAYDKQQARPQSPTDINYVELDELFRESDVISLHVPLLTETEGLINKETLSKMKKTAFLINTSRGKLIKDADLAAALNNEIIAGAGLDVLSLEPPLESNPLLNAKNCLLTPHIAWATREARQRLMNFALENLKAFLEGNKINAVN